MNVMKTETLIRSRTKWQKQEIHLLQNKLSFETKYKEAWKQSGKNQIGAPFLFQMVENPSCSIQIFQSIFVVC